MTTPRSVVLHPGAMPQISRVGGASTTQVVTPACGTRAFLTGFTDIPPGAAIPLHYHNCEECILIVEGVARIEADGIFHDAVKDDVIWQPAGVPHRFINPSDTQTLRIYWTYGSIDATRTLVDTGETGPILAEHASNG